ETRLSFSPAATRLRAGSAQHRTRVEPLGRSSFAISVAASVNDHREEGELARPANLHTPEARLAEARSAYQEWLGAATTLDSDNALFNTAIERSLLDRRLLVNRLDNQWLFGAGIPWYATLFGRDSLITGFEMLAWNPELAAGILRLLARNQGWKDSGDGIAFADGRLPVAPIALVEVQGYLYAAYRAMARLRLVLDPENVAGERELSTRAARLKERFNQDFWMPDSRFYALG